jgi:BolA protein
MPGELEFKILEKLKEEYNPSHLNIENVSYLHFGHESIKGNTSNETHFRIQMTSEKFKGVSTINRHKMVYKTLDFAFKMGLHALELKCEI